VDDAGLASTREACSAALELEDAEDRSEVTTTIAAIRITSGMRISRGSLAGNPRSVHADKEPLVSLIANTARGGRRLDDKHSPTFHAH
jgi:hypothetical protein